jgi:hypothetical protein
LFERPTAQAGGISFDITPDGRRILVLLEPEFVPPTHIRIITNWLTELRESIPAEN